MQSLFFFWLFIFAYLIPWHATPQQLFLAFGNSVLLVAAGIHFVKYASNHLGKG